MINKKEIEEHGLDQYAMGQSEGIEYGMRKAKEEIREKVKEKRRYVHNSAGNPPYPSGYNDALDDILSLLTNKE